MKTLVTGADGFIGSHLVEALVRSGFSVRAMAHYNSFGSRGWLDDIDIEIAGEVDIVLGDIRDSTLVKSLMTGCDSVFHLAALIGIPYSYRAPQSYVDTNVQGTLNVLQAALELGVSRLIHTSTSEVYGSALYVPIDESHPLQAQSPYSATKIAADQLALSFWRSFEVPVVVLRPFNTYGPRQSARAIIPTVISQILSGASNLSVGSTHPTRDLSFVTDTTSGFVAALRANGVEGKTLNLGSSFEISIEDLIRAIASKMGVDITLQPDAERIRPEKSEVERLFSDNSLAKQLLEWEPQYSGLDGLSIGLDETIAWFSNAQNRDKYLTEGFAY